MKKSLAQSNFTEIYSLEKNLGSRYWCSLKYKKAAGGGRNHPPTTLAVLADSGSALRRPAGPPRRCGGGGGGRGGRVWAAGDAGTSSPCTPPKEVSDGGHWFSGTQWQKCPPARLVRNAKLLNICFFLPQKQRANCGTGIASMPRTWGGGAKMWDQLTPPNPIITGFNGPQ